MRLYTLSRGITLWTFKFLAYITEWYARMFMGHEYQDEEKKKPLCWMKRNKRAMHERRTIFARQA